MDYTKKIANIKKQTRDKVELIETESGFIPKSMKPSVSVSLEGIYEIAEISSQSGRSTVLRKSMKKIVPPKRVYGDIMHWVHLVMASYVELGKSSILVYGKKGNGKSLLTDIIAVTAGEKFDLPIIIVGRIQDGQNLLSILRQIGPCILYIDEFTKVIPFTVQEDLLSYLSSSDSMGSIVLITANSISNLSDYIKQRPDRIRYQAYRGNVDEHTVKEYCSEKLEHPQYVDDIIKLALNSNTFNMDSLMAVVSELNMRHDGKLSFLDMVDTLNISIKKGPSYIVTKIEFKDTGITYSNVELVPQNYGRFEFKLLLTLSNGVTNGKGHFSKMEHKGFENGTHKYGVMIRVNSTEVRSLDAIFYIKELAPNMGDGNSPI